jgi:hypothetical protein
MLENRKVSFLNQIWQETIKVTTICFLTERLMVVTAIVLLLANQICVSPLEMILYKGILGMVELSLIVKIKRWLSF